MIETRHEEMRKQAKAYHEQNPIVWNLFQQFTFELIERGFKNYGAKGVMERVRWDTDQPTVDGKSRFKINNNYTAFYARKFMIHYPQYKGFFRIRKQISVDKHATGQRELTPEDYKYI